jgi:hypothetical protein
MVTKSQLIFLDRVYESLLVHLLPNNSRCEEAAFGFAKTRTENDRLVFDLVEFLPVPKEGFASRSELYLQLTDEMRALVIKHAHDLRASLIEFHSHPFQHLAEFSPSDRFGFEEFVPHVNWRLKGQPYAAFVFTHNNFDALAWLETVDSPINLTEIVADGQIHSPTGLSIANWSKPYHEQSF